MPLSAQAGLVRLLVVGGGITGLAAAWEAIRGSEGLPPAEVVLVEAADTFGGKVRTEVVDSLLIEHGPDSFVAYRPAALKLIEELGLADQVISISGTRTVYLRSRGRLRPLPSGMGMVLPTKLWPFVTTGILSPLDKLRAGFDLLLPRRLRNGQDTTIGAFLRARLGGGIVQRFADPMVGGIYGASVDELSLDAVLPSLRADEAKYRSLMLASLAAGRKARSAARGPSSPFRTLNGGLGSLISALVEQLTAAGVSLHTGLSVDRLTPLPGGGAEARFSDGSTQHFDAVVLAAGVEGSEELLKAAAPAAAAALAQVPLATSTVLSLAYPAEAFANPVTTHGWLEADPAPISGITVSSAKWAGRAPVDTVLIRAFVPGRLGAIAEAPEAELIAAVTDHVGGVLGAQRPPTSVRVSRWPRMMPKYTLGHLDRVAAVEAGLANLPCWRVAGSPLRGVGVPDCVADGRRQADLALTAAALGRVRVEE
ncbi:MAG: protoporphyrinogen oxidase [Actinobacteria bacterium]|nr:protoporphyrinogen oxidase [Actinomycetota bacterium]MBU4207759.1 protoporphyrinogen oxidase [Actinomycetota bacterium]MBU4249435.1 protoporphyrinogen oxidase [Actinomycetota bacterium]MBU4362858.1 protoporphyrinogen oxidase [Actinomycetota bacterium]MBU4410382.1 protoporphyrinogen oxidase [Actinomycetota bacterium]